MALLPPPPRLQCDRCRTVIVLTATKSDQYGADLFTAGWRARPLGGRYRHACPICAVRLIAKFEAGVQTAGMSASMRD